MNHSYPRECTLHLRSCARKVFEVQLNKNNTCALLSCILSIVSSHWLQHEVYECMIIGLHPSWQHMDVWCHLPCCLPYYMMTGLHHDKTKMFDVTFPAAFHTIWWLAYIMTRQRCLMSPSLLPSILYDDWFTSWQDKDVWCHLPCCLPYYMMTGLHHDKTKMFDVTFPAAFHTIWWLAYIMTRQRCLMSPSLLPSILYDDWLTSWQDKDVWCHLPCCLPYYMMTSLHHDKTKMFDATFPAAFHTVWLLVYIHHDNTWMFDVMFPDAFHIVWWLVYIRHDNT